MVTDLRFFNIFKNVLRIATGSIKKCTALLEVVTQLSRNFPDENVRSIERKKIEYLWHYFTDFVQSFIICCEDNELSNKSYWDDLDSTDQG